MTKIICPTNSCDSEKFMATQQAYIEIYVNSDNDYIDTLQIAEAEEPYGPYTCIRCGRTFNVS